jgi:predicted ester cyclase
MTRSNRLCLAAFAAVAACACTAPAPPPTPPPPVAPAPMTAEQSVDWYKKCWGLFNDKNWDAFQNCYAPDATSESVDSGRPPESGRAAIVAGAQALVAPNPDVRGDLQLVIASGNRLVSVALWQGTHTAAMPGPDGKEIPATGKKFSFLMAHTLQLDAGRTAVKADADYVDVGTFLGQLGLSKAPVRKPVETGLAEPVVAIAKNDAAEAQNVAVVQASFEALNKHDLKALGVSYSDSYVLHEIARPADADKKESLMSMGEIFKGFPDVTITPSEVVGAGDYVVAIGSFEGTNKGGLPSMGIKKNGKHVVSRFLNVFRLEGGKVAEEWLFYNSAGFMSQLTAP